MLAIGLVSFEGSLRSQAAFGSWAQGFNHPTNSFTYTHPSFPATTIAWPPTFKAINLAVIPGSDNVIVWDHRHANQTSYGQSYPWQQRFSVGNPEAPASFVNYVVYIDDLGRRTWVTSFARVTAGCRTGDFSSQVAIAAIQRRQMTTMRAVDSRGSGTPP